MLETKELALKHSLHCFFNSYLRDSNTSFDADQNCFTIKLEEAELKIPVEFYSQVGVHQFGNEITISVPKGFRQIGFLEAAELICYQKGEGQSGLFKRLLNSIHNMSLSLESNQKAITDLYSGHINFLSAEQGLLIGHNFHPTPKSRDEFSDEDLKAYAPEWGAHFTLSWFLVKTSLIWEERSQNFSSPNWQSTLYKREVPSGYVPFPVHPWQKKILLKDPVIKEYLKQGLMLDGAQGTETWYATSSMRSLYCPQSKFMLKFSMSVKMTNSVRHLQQKEVVRGMMVQDAFSTPQGQEFSKRFPQFNVLHEPLTIAIKDPGGKILPQTVALLRENPFQKNLSMVATLATLTQNHPYKGQNLIARCLNPGVSGLKWFEAFVSAAIIPLLVAQADYGIMLGAHQQNLLLVLENGLPVGSYFRDCQGTAFSDLAEKLIKNSMPHPEKFEILPMDAAIVLFTYYLIINSLLNTIAAVAAASKTTEAEMIISFQQTLKELRSQVKDPRVLDHLLNSSELKQKGNFRCSLLSINENTTENPLSIYNSIPNPFYLESSV